MTIDEAPRIHPTAIVEPAAVVGPGSAIWHHCHIRDGASVGERCVLGKGVYVDEGVTVGNDSKIQNNVSLYKGVTLGEKVFVGPSAVFTNDLFPRAMSPDWTVVSTEVGEGASIGANATIVCGTSLGAWSMVAAGSVVTRSVRPHELVRGNPARHGGWVCRCGRIISRDEQQPASLHCGTCVPPGAPG
jgi:UDP-2-acetamido-3-amino-2,3-dideoxy-glucuronate N-acetyltransferase